MEIIRAFLSTDAANIHVVPLIFFGLDYSNSLLAGLPDNILNKRQRIQNHAAQLVLPKSKHASATALLRALHWLPVKVRIQYKFATSLCFQSVYQNSIPPYLSGLLRPYYLTRSLRSLDSSLLTVPCFSLEIFGKRSFSVWDPVSWTPHRYPSEKHNYISFRRYGWVCVCVCARALACVCVCYV